MTLKKRLLLLAEKGRGFYLLAGLYSLTAGNRTGGGVKLNWRGVIRRRTCVKNTGHGNSLDAGARTILDHCSFHFCGENCRVTVGEGCHLKNCSFWIKGSGHLIAIGDRVTAEGVGFVVEEENLSIIVGDDCMFSYGIDIRASDSHAITDIRTGERLNPGRDIRIGNHVWIGAGTAILKGSRIGDHTVVGMKALVTKEIPAACLACGTPAEVKKREIRWTRENEG